MVNSIENKAKFYMDSSNTKIVENKELPSLTLRLNISGVKSLPKNQPVKYL